MRRVNVEGRPRLAGVQRWHDESGHNATRRTVCGLVYITVLLHELTSRPRPAVWASAGV